MASTGDQLAPFKSCVNVCRSNNCKASGPDALVSETPLWLLGWTWCVQPPGGAQASPLRPHTPPPPLLSAEDCNYQCMHSTERLRAMQGQPPVQYFGKWPFTRVAGCQELLSTVFSMGNALPHLFFLLFLWPTMPSSGMSGALAIYALGCINTWWWSTAFHCRDNFWTERLDYHCASVLLVMTLLVTIVRVLRVRSRLVMAGIAALLLGAFALHVAHMNLVLFDYGWNMKLSIGVVATNILLWLGWVAVHVRKRPYVLHMAVLNCALVAAGMFEVYDFSPVWGHLDAHATWHGLTIPIGFYWYYIFYTDFKAETQHCGADSLYAPAPGSKAKVDPPAAPVP